MANKKASTLQDAGRTFASLNQAANTGHIKLSKDAGPGSKKGKPNSAKGPTGSKAPAASKTTIRRSQAR